MPDLTLPPLPDILSDATRNVVVASDEWAEFIEDVFIDPDGPLANRDHFPLAQCSVGVLFSNAQNRARGRRIIGTAEMSQVRAPDVWRKIRAEQATRSLFGHTPNFIITLDAGFIARASAHARGALIEHELHHCGIALDEENQPRMTADGVPIWTIKPHDVEEFIGPVVRYGAEHTGAEMLVRAAMQPATLDADLVEEILGGRIRYTGPETGAFPAHACGTCGTPLP